MNVSLGHSHTDDSVVCSLFSTSRTLCQIEMLLLFLYTDVFFFSFSQNFFSMPLLVQRARVFSVPVHEWAKRSERFGLSVLALSLNLNLTLTKTLVSMVRLNPQPLISSITPVPVFKKGSDESEHWAWGLIYFRINKNFLAEVLQIHTRNLPRSFLITQIISDF